MARAEIRTRNLRLSEREEEEEEEERETTEEGGVEGWGDVTAEALRVGGECRRGRTWSWLYRSLQLVFPH